MNRDNRTPSSQCPLRVIVLGKGTLAIRAAYWFRAQSGYRLQCVVPAIPEPKWTDSLVDWCTNHRVPTIATGDYRDVPASGDGDVCDLAFSVFYDRIIKSSFLDRCGRALNLHNGPLPRYRGVAPINWALKNGERTHGVTIHEITSQVDGGPIVAQVCFDIHPDVDEVIDVYRRALDYGRILFEQTMPILNRITPRPQNESDATYYSASEQRRLGERRDFTRESSLRTDEPEQDHVIADALTDEAAFLESRA